MDVPKGHNYLCINKIKDVDIHDYQIFHMRISALRELSLEAFNWLCKQTIKPTRQVGSWDYTSSFT